MSASLPSWARVGAKVVCVNASGSGDGKTPLIEGRTYTIRSINDELSTACAGIRLAEITNGRCPLGWEWHYNITRFRPAVEPKSEAEDLAHFTHLLTAHHPQEVDA